MKALVLGGSGMLGHKLWQELSPQFDTYVTLREGFSAYSEYDLFDASQSMCHVSVFDIDSVEGAIKELRPDVVINCIGAVKQAAEAKDPFISIAVNSLFPHQVAQFCRAVKSRLIHISTDCVFSGRAGNYAEDDLADAEDLYGRTKFLGEVAGESCTTIRTSMVGRELQRTNGLIEWFMSQEGETVPGYMRSVFSGLTTNALAKLIALIVQEHRDTDGIWHVASEPICKHDLLCMVKEVYGLEIEITPDEAHIVDRSLNGDRFRKRTGYVTPSWQEMIEEMHQDPTPYSEIRRAYADR
jgi:dTDP-4-dehydrorhamnose reductase